MRWRLLDGLGEADARAVLAVSTRRRYRKGDTVFHAGDPGETLHLLDRGHVAVRAATPMGDVATLAVLGPGDCFGELALVGIERERSASVVALDATETLVLHRRDFEELCARQASVRDLLVQLLSDQVRRLSDQVVEALYLPAEKRVVRRLRGLVRVYGADGDDDVPVPVTQDDLASLAGTTRSTTNRVLQELAAEGVVSLSRGRTVVHDVADLDRRAR